MSKNNENKWCVYIVRCNDNTLYTGITNNLDRRIKEHNSSDLGAKYTRGRRPVKLLYSQNCEDKSDASKLEYKIKQLTRDEKLDLIKQKGQV